MLIPALPEACTLMVMTEKDFSTAMVRPHDQPQHFEPTSSSDSFHHHHHRAHHHHHASTSRGRQECGSLPLKKRRYHEITSFHESAAAAVVCSTQALSSDPNDVSLLVNNPHSRVSSDKETLAALALVATARASGSGILSSTNDSFSMGSQLGNPNASNSTSTSSSTHLQPINISGDTNNAFQNHDEHNFRSSPQLHLQALSQPAPTTVPSIVPSIVSDKPVVINKPYHSTTESSISAKPPQPRQRINHPPLTSPIPGGCHGRTSRNNSYCRRTPCYKNSKFCKLHYQQYVVQGGADPNCVDIVKLDRIGKKGISDCNNISNAEVSCTVLNVGGQRNHQDKRFTGNSKDEIQCLATTTRGRPCAYVAVQNTKYCHLHADYDTNPPPRRGGSSAGTQKIKLQSNTVKVEGQTTLVSGIVDVQTICTVATSARSNSHSSKVLGNISSNFSSKKVSYPLFKFSTSTIPSKNDLASGKEPSTIPPTIDPPPPFPLLNSIPSDKWSDKLVLISTGPLVNHVGRVLKWGNGWITVATTTGGKGTEGSGEILHNRRAIELYLVPEELLDGTSTHDDVSIDATRKESSIVMGSNSDNDKFLPQDGSLSPNKVVNLKENNSKHLIKPLIFEKPSMSSSLMENVDSKAENSGTHQLTRQSEAHSGERYGYEALHLGTKSESEDSGTHMCKEQSADKDQPFRTSIDTSKNDMLSLELKTDSTLIYKSLLSSAVTDQTAGSFQISDKKYTTDTVKPLPSVQPLHKVSSQTEPIQEKRSESFTNYVHDTKRNEGNHGKKEHNSIILKHVEESSDGNKKVPIITSDAEKRENESLIEDKNGTKVILEHTLLPHQFETTKDVPEC